MPGRLRWFVMVVATCGAVALVAWWGQFNGDQESRPGWQPPVEIWDKSASPASFESSAGSPVDPTAAVATILELRSEFGSVLANSALLNDVPPDDPAGEHAAGLQSFDDFLWAEAGAVPPEVDAAADPPAAAESGGTLAPSLRDTANLLESWLHEHEDARGSGSSHDVARLRRFEGLVTLLRAEAEALTEVSPSAP